MKTNYISLLEPLELRIAPALTSPALFLSQLHGDNGFTVGGTGDNDFLGRAVSDAGDVNGDGFGDFIVGAPGMDLAGKEFGGAYVVFGSKFPGGPSLPLSSLNGANGFQILGEEENAALGIAVSAAGDVNGDGFGDVVIGAPGFQHGATERGAAYVIFGHAGAFMPTFQVGALDGSNGFRIEGSGGGHRVGGAVSAAGDVDRDGFDDIIIGASGAPGDVAGSGAAYVVFGKASAFPASLLTSSLAGSIGCKFPGILAGDLTGSSVGGGGDVNGDGFDDVIIGAPHAAGGGTMRGEAYVVLGGLAFGQLSSISLAGLAGSGGFAIRGVADGDLAGYAVDIAGDINADGLDDALIGAPGANEGGTERGASYVIFGHAADFGSTFQLSALLGPNGFKLSGKSDLNNSGIAVGAAGDVNGDGIDDLLIGATHSTIGGLDRGTGYLVYGHTGAFAATLPLVLLSTTNGFQLPGVSALDSAGMSVSVAGDCNGDGFGDILIGAPLAEEPGGTNRGAAYVVYGGPSGTPGGATVLADHKVRTFLDVDGDLVTVKVSKGDLLDADFDLIRPDGIHANFLALHLPASFAGADVTITAKPTADGGDGRVNLGFLDALGVDLGKVSIAGNVERTRVGDPNALAPAFKSFTAQSLGAGALPLHDTFGADYYSKIDGAAGPLTVKGDANLAQVVIDGSLAKLTLGGSLIGGGTSGSGSVSTANGGNIGAVKVGQDIRGGSADFSGYITSDGNLASITVGGSILGGGGFFGAAVSATKNIGNVSLIHDLEDGRIWAGGNIGKVTIGGSVVRTSAESYAGLTAVGSLGAILVKGNLLGAPDAPFVISGGGPLTGQKSVAIASVTVKGSVEHAVILGGSPTNNGHAQIGSVLVHGDWTASSIVAGAQTAANNSALGWFGNGDDILWTAGAAGGVARIASIVIKGAVTGTAAGGDHFGFVAQEIGSLKVGAVKYALKKGVANDAIALGSTPDFKLLEV